MGKSLDPKRLSIELSNLDATVVTTSLSETQQDNLLQLLGGETPAEA